jgi:predicted dehydrogenase
VTALRVGVAGAGYWAQEIHVPVLRDHPGVTLVGIWNRTAAHAKTLADAAGTRTFDNYEDMLESVDAVSFVVAPEAQPDLVARAVARGRHLLLEKPLALSLPAGEALVASIARAKVASIVFFTRRFEAEVARDLDLIAAERHWQCLSARFFSGAMLPGTPFAHCLWRQRLGALWDVGPHALSVLLPVMGDVAAVEATREEPRITRLHLIHINGAQTNLALSLHAESAEQGEFYLFHTESNVAQLNVAPALRRGAYHNAVDALIAAVGKGLPHPCDAGFALRVLHILVAADLSLSQGGMAAVVAQRE